LLSKGTIERKGTKVRKEKKMCGSLKNSMKSSP